VVPESVAAVLTPEEFRFPVTLPTKVAVTIPALNPPLAFLATIVPPVLLLVALEVTVNVEELELLKVAEPLNPVPDVFRVKVF
jgi:hypothetical protein